MIEFLLECIKPANLPATTLLALVLLYWLLMIFGALGLDAFDVDLDGDADVDVDGDFHAGGFVTDVLTFFHLGDVPVMIFASFFVLFFWTGTVVGNHYWNTDWSLLITGYFFIPNVIISLILTKLVLMPIAPLFRSMTATEQSKIIGSTGSVSTSKLDGEFGQVSIEHDGPPIVINARTENGQLLMKDQLVKVLRVDPDSGVYFVAPAKPEKI